jgi:acyl carrier protein
MSDNPRATIEATLRRLAETDRIEPNARLVKDLGLDSMDLAELVAVLELELGMDPFAERVSIADVHTVADLLAAYQVT